MTIQPSFKIAHYTVNPSENSIEAEQGEATLLQAKIMEVLVYLANNYPRLVTRKELIDTIWQGNYPVGEKTLTNAIWRLRQVLKQGDESLIKTVRKGGYRLLLQPEHIHAEASNPLSKPRLANASKQFLSNWPILISVCLVVIISFFYFSADNKVTVDISNLTTEPGRELFPSVSPNGKYLIYVWRKMDNKSDVYLKDLTQPDLPAKQLTFSDEIENSPIWHNDGEKIYFTSRANDNSYCHIVELNLANASRKVITNCATKVKAEIALSQDGKTLAFTHQSKSEPLPGIYFLALDNKQAKPQRFSCGSECKYQDRKFAFSPNNKYLAVTRRTGRLVENIFLVDIANNTSQQLTFGAGDIKGLVWQPNGKKIVYASANSGRREGYIVDITSKEITALNVPGFSYPSYIAYSNSIAFHQWQVRSFLSQINLSDTSASAPFPLLQSQFDYHSPDYNAISQQLTFISNESGHSEIWRASNQGKQHQQLTQLQSQLSFPRWSHDGSRIVFLAAKEKSLGNNIYILDISTQRVNKLESNYHAHFRPNWSFDDSAIIVNVLKEHQSTLVKLPLSGEPAQVLLARDVLQAVQDANENIWFTTNKKDGLWLLDAQKSKQQSTPVIQPVLNKQQFSIDYNWTVTPTGIYYQHDSKQQHSINYYDFASKKIDIKLKLPMRTLDRHSSMAYIAEHNQLVFTQTDFPQIDIKQLKHSLIE